MVKVLKYGNKTFKKECPMCGCEFTYSQEDLCGVGILCPGCGTMLEHNFSDMLDENGERVGRTRYWDYKYIPSGSSDACSDCEFYKSSLAKGIQIGDSPCSWCKNGQLIFCEVER